MKISQIETIPVLVPILPERAIKASGGYHTESPFLIVKVHTDAGIIGLGEVSCTPIWSGEDHFTAARIIETLLAPALVGEDPTAIEHLTIKMSRAVAGNPFTKSGLEMALWDILGKAAGLPVYNLLGGPVRDSVQIKFSISGLKPERSAEIARWAVDQGFRTVKVKVGIDPEEDVARVRAVREAVGPDIRLGVDANGGWNVREAIRTIGRLEEFDLLFVEQPVPANDVAWMADVRAHCSVPLLADESVYTPQDALSLIRAGAADAFSVYVGKGGIGPARKVAAIAEAAGLTCTVGSNLELGIATAAMIHLAMATQGIDPDFIPCDIIGPYYYPTDLLTCPTLIQSGYARPPELPGLGIELDEQALNQYRVTV